ncbi:unnamed protein product [Phytomonas sp. Hart1]|nr:unnamed protein product [Phytomonas sp. Hart1]|eukprot:CCW72204.1 unnamed protein product [Phytomonas sp. isolate Hart1]
MTNCSITMSSRFQSIFMTHAIISHLDLKCLFFSHYSLSIRILSFRLMIKQSLRIILFNLLNFLKQFKFLLSSVLIGLLFFISILLFSLINFVLDLIFQIF